MAMVIFFILLLFCCCLVVFGLGGFGCGRGALSLWLSGEAICEGEVECGGSVMVVAVGEAELDVFDIETCAEGEACGV